MSDEQRMQRALKRQRARALAAEAEHERAEARHREWAAEGTRLTREELEAGEPCRGCGRPIIDGRGSWPALLKLSPHERAEHDAAEADYRLVTATAGPPAGRCRDRVRPTAATAAHRLR